MDVSAQGNNAVSGELPPPDSENSSVNPENNEDNDTAEQRFALFIVSSSEYGTVKADKMEGLLEGELISLIIEPVEGYELEFLLIYSADNVPVFMETSTTFKMPASDVKVEASFREKADSEEKNLDKAKADEADKTVVSNVNIKVAAPEINEPASPENIATETAGISIKAGWIVKEGDSYLDLPAEERFESGKQYGIRIECQIESGYCFAENVEATVNQNIARVDYQEKDRLAVIYWFDPVLAVSTLAAAPRLRGAPNNGGSIIIPFTISWDGNADSEATRPASVTVTLYKYLGTFDLATAIFIETKTVTALDGWMGSFDISNEALYSTMPYSPETAYKFKVIQDPVTGYIETEHIDPNVLFNPPEVAGAWQRVTPCNELEITISGVVKSVVVSKKGNKAVVWSIEAFSEAEKEIIRNSALAGINGIGNPTFEFIDGLGIFPEYGITVTETKIQYSDPSDWSFFAYGGYNQSTTEENGAFITNTRNTYGTLTVEKILAGNAASPTKEFAFTVKIQGVILNGTYGGMVFNDSIAEFTLKGGESITAAGLPNGVEYIVAEDDYEADGYATVAAGATGTIIGDSQALASFTNTRNAYGNLIVYKSLYGNGADATKDFAFTVTLGDISINGTFGDMNFVNGVANFSLKGGESATALRLPNGLSYKVEEDDYTLDGYVTTKTNDTGTIVENSSITATFTNTRNAEGSLTIAKTLAGNDVEVNREFEFTITLSDDTISGTFSEVVFTAGKATISLKGGENKVIEGLPHGIDYLVEETDYTALGYVTTAVGDAGTISETVAAVASFTNTRNSYGFLIVYKSLYGNAVDPTKDFAFTVTVADRTFNGEYGEMNFVNGVAKFNLKGGETKTASGLPNGLGYVVEEDDYSLDGYSTIKVNDVGNIVGNSSITATFTNTRNAYGNLTIQKTVTGNDADTEKYFLFTISFEAEGSYHYTGSKTGVIASGETIQLKHGELITIVDLPAGTAYAVTESDNAGYEVTATGANGVIQENETAVAHFTNCRNKVPPTGDDTDINFWLRVMLLSLMAMAVLEIGKRKEIEKENSKDKR